MTLLSAAFLASRCLAEPEWVAPKRLYEIKDNPAIGFFQRIVSMTVSDKEDALYILAGPPDGIYIYRRDNGASWKRFQLDEPLESGDRVCSCSGHVWFVHKKQLFEIAENGKPAEPKTAPAPLPDSIADAICDPAGRLLLVNGARTEFRRYDAKGVQDLRIGPPETEGDQTPGAAKASMPPFNLITDIAIDIFNRIYILDSRARTVFPFEQNGKQLKPVSDDRFSDIKFPNTSHSIAVDYDRNIWVVNPQQNSLDAYSLFGTLVKRIGNNSENIDNGDLGFPFITPAQIIIDADYKLYIIDSAAADVKVFEIKPQ